ncbi:MAG: hypothetical protein K0R65_2986 [Crocinitomicaceae bacterium]|jgi:hypothetical protein|nr:hypothetical protein [Crocinitomicaceae bacterium]
MFKQKRKVKFVTEAHYQFNIPNKAFALLPRCLLVQIFAAYTLRAMNKKSLSLFVFFFGLGIAAQAQEQVTIQTDYNDPYKNIWNVGVFAGIDIQSKNSGGILYGVAGRFTLGKIATFSGNLELDLANQMKSGGLIKYDEALFDKLPSYKNVELRGVFHFRDNESEKDHKIELGSGGGYEYSTNYTVKTRNTQGFTASFNLNSRIYGQNNTDSTRIMELRDMNGVDPGFISGAYTGQDNIVLGVGLHAGEYTYFKGRFSSVTTGSKTRRVRSMSNVNIEFLFAPVIKTGKEAYVKNPAGTIDTYTIEKISKKNMGFRISADVLRGKPGLYVRMELGKKPGIESPIKAEKMSKLLNNGYIMMAFGIGF